MKALENSSLKKVVSAFACLESSLFLEIQGRPSLFRARVKVILDNFLESMVFSSMNKDIECSNVVKLSELSIWGVIVET